MKKIFIYTVAVLMVIGLGAGCGNKAGRKEKKEEVIPVRVMKVGLESLSRSLDYIGNIRGRDEALVYPKVSGKIVEKIKEDGSDVAKGEPIAYIDRDEVGLKFEKAPVESPLAGTVGRVYVDIGSSVSTQTPVALVADMSQAEIDLDIPEKYLPKIAVGQGAEITIDAYPEQKFRGKVTKISPVVDLETRAAPIEIMIENKDRRLQSGMFAKVKLIIEESKKSPIILKEALIGKEPNAYVYVVENEKAILKKVALGIRHGPYVEVVEGIKDGDSVVVMGQQRLRDGSIVAAEEY